MVWGPVPQGGSHEGGKVSTHTPLTGRDGESFRTTEGNATTGAWKAKWR